MYEVCTAEIPGRVPLLYYLSKVHKPNALLSGQSITSDTPEVDSSQLIGRSTSQNTETENSDGSRTYAWLPSSVNTYTYKHSV